MEQNILVGISDFREIRENGYYYIDKTGLIRELLKRIFVCVRTFRFYW